jgi:hypothetical protein
MKSQFLTFKELSFTLSDLIRAHLLTAEFFKEQINLVSDPKEKIAIFKSYRTHAKLAQLVCVYLPINAKDFQQNDPEFQAEITKDLMLFLKNLQPESIKDLKQVNNVFTEAYKHLFEISSEISESYVKELTAYALALMADSDQINQQII